MHEQRKLKPRKGELETKFVSIVSSKKKTIALVHYIKAMGRFLEDKQEPSSNRDGRKSGDRKAQ